MFFQFEFPAGIQPAIKFIVFRIELLYNKIKVVKLFVEKEKGRRNVVSRSAVFFIKDKGGLGEEL
jgi:hypothetical protein